MRHALLVLTVLCGLAAAGAAMAGDPFRISGIAIDAYGKTATEARERALSAGIVRAAYQLLDRLALPEDRLALDPPLEITPEMAKGLVANIEISNEKRSATRYLARLDVNFDADLVRAFLRAHHLPFVETQSSPVLVVALWHGGAADPAAPADNPFARAFAVRGVQDDLVPVVVARDVDAQAMRRLDSLALEALARRTGISDIVVASAEPEGPDAVQVEAHRVHVGAQGVEAIANIGPFEGFAPLGARPSVALRAALGDAARKLADALQTRWKREAMVRGGERQSVRLSVLYDSLAQWQRLRDALGGVSIVEEARLDAFARDGALLTLTFTGTEEQLARLLAQKGVILDNEAIGLTARLQ